MKYTMSYKNIVLKKRPNNIVTTKTQFTRLSIKGIAKHNRMIMEEHNFGRILEAIKGRASRYSSNSSKIIIMEEEICSKRWIWAGVIRVWRHLISEMMQITTFRILHTKNRATRSSNSRIMQD